MAFRKSVPGGSAISQMAARGTLRRNIRVLYDMEQFSVQKAARRNGVSPSVACELYKRLSKYPPEALFNKLIQTLSQEDGRA